MNLQESFDFLEFFLFFATGNSFPVTPSGYWYCGVDTGYCTDQGLSAVSKRLNMLVIWVTPGGKNSSTYIRRLGQCERNRYSAGTGFEGETDLPREGRSRSRVRQSRSPRPPNCFSTFRRSAHYVKMNCWLRILEINMMFCNRHTRRQLKNPNNVKNDLCLNFRLCSNSKLLCGNETFI